MFEGIINHLAEEIRQFESGEDIRNWGDALAGIIRTVAPRDSGVMANILCQVGAPERTRRGWSIGVGNADQLGSPSKKPPSHTISKFLKYMSYPLRSGVESRLAWWLLPSQQKDELYALRQAGMFGGTPGMAPYFYSQEGSKPEWAASAAKAGITPTRFMSDALDTWEGFLDNYVGWMLQ